MKPEKIKCLSEAKVGYSFPKHVKLHFCPVFWAILQFYPAFHCIVRFTYEDDVGPT